MVRLLGKRHVYFTSWYALARQKLTLYREVLDTQVNRMKDGLFPNMGSGGHYAFNSIDAPLWFFWALQQYKENGGSDCNEKYYAAAKSVLQAFKNGTAFNIHMRDNGLIYADAPGKSLTWMDAVVNGNPVTPRRGYAVEINALWYNAICFTLEMAKSVKDKTFIKEFGHLPGLIKNSFLELFWDEKQVILLIISTMKKEKTSLSDQIWLLQFPFPIQCLIKNR